MALVVATLNANIFHLPLFSLQTFFFSVVMTLTTHTCQSFSFSLTTNLGPIRISNVIGKENELWLPTPLEQKLYRC